MGPTTIAYIHSLHFTLSSSSLLKKQSNNKFKKTKLHFKNQAKKNSRSEMENDDIIVAEMRPKKRAGRRIFKETRHPIYRGVRRRNGDKWVCEVREPIHQRRIWLGTYPAAEMAARAHDVAVLALRGKSACLNFADSAWRLPTPESTDPDTIRRTAAEAAEIFRPPEFSSGITVLPLSGSGEITTLDDGTEFTGMMMRLAEEPLMSPPRSFIDMSTSVCIEEEMCYEELSLWSY